MADDKIASMKIAKLVRKLVNDKRTNPAAPMSPPVVVLATPPPRPVQG